MKNYRGKLLGIGRMNLLDNKINEEIKLQEFINSDRDRKNEYGTIFNELNEIYDQMRENAERSLILSNLQRSSNLLTFAYTLYEGSIELQKDDVEREYSYMNRNIDMTKKYLELNAKDYYAESDKILFRNMLERIANLPLHQRISVIDDLLYGDDEINGQIDKYIKYAYNKSRLADQKYLFELFGNESFNHTRIRNTFKERERSL